MWILFRVLLAYWHITGSLFQVEDMLDVLLFSLYPIKFIMSWMQSHWASVSELYYSVCKWDYSHSHWLHSINTPKLDDQILTPLRGSHYWMACAILHDGATEILKLLLLGAFFFFMHTQEDVARFLKKQNKEYTGTRLSQNRLFTNSYASSF